MIIRNSCKILLRMNRNIVRRNLKFLSCNQVPKANFSTSFQDKQNGGPEKKINNDWDDFKDFEKSDVYQTLKGKIKEILEKEKIVLFMKGTPESPLCGYSAKVVQILNNMNVKDYVYIDVMKNNDLREAIKIYSNWPYIPHLYVNNNFIGGCDIISDLYTSGELQEMVK
ncbi:1-cys-glutaredoxin-like protein-1, putative [Plasmodium knowlesi strain H]|uniref:1-cys-glutaredoxin-like protein-1, putative n=3 Tax=Plasmodium knowlesi TaxID=5850 RepID=A0A5K1UNZ2_PLAKH|nr:1-cys-glutaredoxin-like protein-1, putative [Plasmodium knowlesi strain H]OTN65969.1 putative 1-cys-glutaredoxin-like protein-1 [Plasmodium knowlesi]CAA9988024.1 1-cys-glutaredoxin-like protein-1, putative [Plasmodium knowlesi strain H]SBO22007.1 1-cys-glutaredoxin-like protein-1, putative [Plasmodium knowlesi strain H]SBO29479.1 1-cys-glutaredoxin-like protein-1, putative [Plasmodium knowlesi strain H]VVS77498.1 1-cys-glutaredoxin-like protein-1, putative [Plasmodium knowlesi strain H]|eukprot:XP_002259003.1 1-cys-glutaredoxin-like protein-1, putative [Plasmodium knowlesi strain H]